jgi:hypothetical protein
MLNNESVTIKFSKDNGKTFDEWQIKPNLSYDEAVAAIAKEFQVEESQVVIANWLH